MSSSIVRVAHAYSVERSHRSLLEIAAPKTGTQGCCQLRP